LSFRSREPSDALELVIVTGTPALNESLAPAFEIADNLSVEPDEDGLLHLGGLQLAKAGQRHSAHWATSGTSTPTNRITIRLSPSVLFGESFSSWDRNDEMEMKPIP
jgi:hypothetical protein